MIIGRRNLIMIAVLAGAVSFAGAALAQGYVGGPKRQVLIGGPKPQTSPVMPSRKVGTMTYTQPQPSPCPQGACAKTNGKR